MKISFETKHPANANAFGAGQGKQRDSQCADNPYSAKNNTKPVNFYCAAPEAKSVRLIGDFNRWSPVGHPMSRRIDASWFLQVPLAHGHHQYAFLVDGKRVLDPRATGVARDGRGEPVSVIAVS